MAPWFISAAAPVDARRESVAELTAFPAGRHDDQVDSTAQALAWAKQRPAAAGMIDDWRRLGEEG